MTPTTPLITAAWQRHAQAFRYSWPGGFGGYVHLVQPSLVMAEPAFAAAVREVLRDLGRRPQQEPQQ